MNQRPFSLTLFAIAMLMVAVSIPVQAALLQDFAHLTQNLTWLNILVMILCGALAITALNAHWSLRLLLPITIFTVIFNNWWIGHVAMDFSLVETSFASFGFVAMSGILCEKQTLQVLMNPRLNWWRRSPRSQITVPVVLSPWLRGSTLYKKTFDLSDSGIFVQGLEVEELINLKLGERFEIRLKLEGQSEIHCTARLVRKTEGAGIYPAGVGLTFEGLSANEKYSLKKFSKKTLDSTLIH